MTDRGVQFSAGTVVSAGMYRNSKTGAVRWFDGATPIPGSTNAPTWQQVSDHQHPEMQRGAEAPEHAAASPHGVAFTPGSMVSAGMYRNTRTGEERWFDGTTPIPGSVNSPSWQQVSDHYHDAGQHALTHGEGR